MRHRERAICLRAADYSETSQVLHFFTRGLGAVRLLGKGTKRAKSKSGGAVDLLSEGELVFSTGRGDGLGTLIEYTETVSRRSLRADAGRLNAALYLAELASETVEQSDPHPEMFDLLHNALRRLGDADAPVEAVLAYAQWRMLRHVGLMGELTRCVSCGRAVAGAGGQVRGAYFSSGQGGLLCAACEDAVAEKYRLDGQGAAGLAALAAAGAGSKVQLPSRQARAVNRLLAYHVRQQLGKPLRMARHVIRD